jgi:eukaryotic-like serine/threonine-protein kinase
MSALASDADRFRQARRLFEDIVELAEAERVARLGEVAATDAQLASAVRVLLSADRRAQSFLSHPGDLLAPDPGPEPGEDPDEDRCGDTIGRYRLTELLGRGGMGEVYLAERVDGRFEQTVAVKLVKRGMDTFEILRRFARERRILARLEHPGIARLLDGGETPDGRPYFVMERVTGRPITEYCRARNLALDDRLRLVASCCDAVDAAHRSLVVHRDLKPSNMLVTSDGEVKLLDFGIAKMMVEEGGETTVLTHRDGRVLTPAYAAPEQILGGSVTVATDVFALGVVLYELLTGVLPYDRSAATPRELCSRVERESAERPSRVSPTVLGTDGSHAERARWTRRLRGDLDNITMKALAREAQRRYPSAAALAEDLRCYLASRPITARPDSPFYRLRKFTIRHRFGVSAAGLVVVALLGALSLSLNQTAAARREARRAEAAQGFLTGLFAEIDPDRYSGSAPTVLDLLERGSERLDHELDGQPELRADMDALLGRVFDQLRFFEQGEAHWRRAVDTRSDLFGADDVRTAKVKKGLAISLARQGRHAEARELFEDLLSRAEELGDRRELASLHLNHGNLLRLMWEFAASESHLERAIGLLESEGEPARESLARALTNLGYLHSQRGRHRDAAAALERALAIRIETAGPESSMVARSRKNLSHTYRELGELDVAERYAWEALTVVEALLPLNDPLIATTLESLGQLAHERGDRAEARALYERSIATYEASPRPDLAGLAHSLRLLGALALEEGAHDEAVTLHQRALETRLDLYGDHHPEIAQSWHDLARDRIALGDSAGALDAARTGVSVLRAALPANSLELAEGLVLLGDVLRGNGRADEALASLQEAEGILRSAPFENAEALADLDAALAAIRAGLR